jgi:uncharacterized protein
MNTDNEKDGLDSIRQGAAFVLPFMVFMLIASRYPSVENFDDPTSAKWYAWMVAAQVIIAIGWLVYFRKIYLKHFPLRWSLLSVVVGAIGVVLWIGICELKIEPTILSWVGLEKWAARPSFNPYQSLTDAGLRTTFLILRFTLLALLVPIVEELFLRGFLVRYVNNPNWETTGLKGLSMMALLTPSIYGALTHPMEAIAAVVWFGLVTWLMVRTGNLWDCVIAHAVTNLLLGVYIVNYSAWHLW